MSRRRNKEKSFSSKYRNSRSVLVIGGSDSAGAAGIQVDLRVLSAIGVHGASAITAVTAQTSARVISSFEVPPAKVRDQIAAAFDEFDIGAVKIGMLANARIVRAVAVALKKFDAPNIVLDPVLLSTSGARLLSRDGVAALKNRLAPLATILTPNLPEAASLLGKRQADKASAEDLLQLGARAILLKGGHRARGDIVDRYFDGERDVEFRHARLPYSVRGTGCALASAMAAYLSQGFEVFDAVRRAEAFLQKFFRTSRAVGRGSARFLALGG